MYVIVKLLVKSEVPGTLHDVWFWLNLSWTIIASVLLIIYTLVLRKIKVDHAPSRISINVADGDIEEKRPLLEKNAEKGDKSKKVSLKRLLSLSKPDIPFLIMGFVFLTLSSTGLYSNDTQYHW